MKTQSRAPVLLWTSFFLFAAFSIACRLYAIFHVYAVMDEIEDPNLLKQTVSGVSSFFQGARFPDQARLPHLAAVPLAYLPGSGSLGPLRVLFLGFHILFLWLSYRLALLLTRDKGASGLYVFLLLSSCYFAAFSIFSITTSNWLYVLFHGLCVYSFWSSFSEQKRSGLFPDYIRLGFLMGCCVASSLFGLILMPAIFAFHILYSRKKIHVRAVPPLAVIFLSAGFLISIWLINVRPIQPLLRSVLALGQSMLYFSAMLYLGFRERSKRSPLLEANPLVLWAALGLAAACFTLILSPIYLNIDNIAKIPKWVEWFRVGPLIDNRRPFDGFRILLIKFGPVSSLALLLPLLHIFRKKISRWSGEFHFLVVLILFFHLTIIGTSSFLLAHYFLAIVPFLYLAFVKFWLDAKNGPKIMSVIASLALLTAAADNQFRYFMWFPYSHWDGAQYGSEEVGFMNRAAMISLEPVPLFVDYLVSSGIAGDKPVTLLLNVPGKWPRIPFGLYRRPALKDALKKRGIRNVRVMNVGRQADMVLLSDYDPFAAKEMASMNKEYKLVKTLSIKGVYHFYVWKTREGSSG